MPHLLFYAMIATVAFIGYRAFKREAERVSARVRSKREHARNGTQGTLVKDPVTGEYHIARD